jgi:DNA repair protein RadC
MKKPPLSKYHYSNRIVSIAAEGEPIPSVKIQTACDMVDYLRKVYPDDMDIRETFVCVYLNRANITIGHSIIGVGGVDSCIVDPRVVFSNALSLPGINGMILSHNHPSGNTHPSEADRSLTKKLKAGAEILHIKLLDHIILTDYSYLSFLEEGML